MGEFVAVSAIRAADIDAVTEAVGGFFRDHGWPVALVDGVGQVDSENGIHVFAPAAGWTLVVWPGYFTELAVAEYLSAKLDTVVSTVRIYDGDYWSHSVFAAGDVVDRFASRPDYFTDDPDEIATLAQKWAGDPAAIARTFGRPASEVAPYLTQLVDDEEVDGEEEPAGARRAFADDEFALDDPWVFVDFWRRLGISYPSDVSDYARQLHLASGWLGRIPAGDADL